VDVVNIVVEIFWTNISLRELLRRDPGNITFQFNYEILLGRGLEDALGISVSPFRVPLRDAFRAD
jgi:hypothetical protein